MMVDLTITAERPQGALPGEPFHRLEHTDGTQWTAFFRLESGYLLRFPDLADFAVSSDGKRVDCAPVPEVSPTTIEHLYLNQVLPLALSKQGRHVYHASAVDFGGSAVAFLAASGRGKSTLAASFAVNGYRFLTDDGLMVEQSVDGFVVLPSHPSIRLWDDSHAKLLEPDAKRSPALDFTSKARFMAGDQLTHCDQPRPLRAVYFLGGGDVAQTSIRRLSALQALAEWAKHSFLLDVEDKRLMRAHFDHIVMLANRLPAYHLDYVRRYEDLDNLRSVIVDHANQ